MDRDDQEALLDSNYGRDHGWTVLRDGEAVAHLSEPHRQDMYWYRYKVDALTPEVLEDGFWDQKLVYRNHVTGQVAPNAHPGGELPSEDNPYILMRALYIPVRASWRQKIHSMLKRR